MTVHKALPQEWLAGLSADFRKPEELIGENGLLKTFSQAAGPDSLTDVAIEAVRARQSRPLHALSPVVYLHCSPCQGARCQRLRGQVVYLAPNSLSQKWTRPLRN